MQVILFDAMRDSQVKWQCRRGMRELDELLIRYFEQSYDAASDAEKVAFRELLALPDPELAGYLIAGKELDDGVSARVIRRIRSRARPDEVGT